MSETTRETIENIFREKSKGQPMLTNLIKAKMIMRGVHPNALADSSYNDPSMLAKLESILREVK
jgi:hypothetical protein